MFKISVFEVRLTFCNFSIDNLRNHYQHILWNWVCLLFWNQSLQKKLTLRKIQLYHSSLSIHLNHICNIINITKKCLTITLLINNATVTVHICLFKIYMIDVIDVTRVTLKQTLFIWHTVCLFNRQFETMRPYIPWNCHCQIIPHLFC